MSLRRLLDLAQKDPDPAGEMRLVAWIDGTIPGQEIQPAAPQHREAAAVIAHLRYGFGPEPRPDANSHDMVDPDKPRVMTPEDVRE